MMPVSHDGLPSPLSMTPSMLDVILIIYSHVLSLPHYYSTLRLNWLMMDLWMMMMVPQVTAGIPAKVIPEALMGMELTQQELVIKVVGPTQPVPTTIQPPVVMHFMPLWSHGRC